MSPTSSLGLVELRLKRQEVKISKITLAQAKVDLDKQWVSVDDDTLLIRYTFRYLCIFLCTLVICLTTVLAITSTVGHYYTQRQITNCEHLITLTTLQEGNCPFGVIGQTTTTGNNPGIDKGQG